METKPLILVSNDDGITAKGINELIKYIRPLGEIVVVAPDSARSGSGCALSVTLPVHYQLVHQEPGLTTYQCTGTPSDCIKLARNVILTRKPDLVIGGINHGDNSATNTHYSGTMGIAIEGCLNRIPSIGFSLCNHLHDADFEPTREYIQKIVRKVLEKGLPPLVCLNVNFPDTKEIKGIKVCSQTDGYWEQEWDACTCHPGYYWLSGMFVNSQPDNEKNDRWALNQGYAAITPTKVDITAYEFMDELRNMLCD
ncbi:5'-nucleotidase SurE [termite gut metagenome]|uniref:5'-nucleotidase SurE n=1 Tax=termite gut metagenome TaxID=433724 RepID=A0A5J4SU58_9ZZZZ